MSKRGTASEIPGWYLELQKAVLTALPRDIPQNIAIGWTENGESLTRTLRTALTPPEDSHYGYFGIWKTITLGTYPTVDDLITALTQQEKKISEYAKDLFYGEEFMLAKEQIELNLAISTVKELTGRKKEFLHDIIAGIRRLGGDICPAEVGPQLRLQLKHQPTNKNERLIIATEPIRNFEGEPCLFTIEHNDSELLLDATYEDRSWEGTDLFVYVIPPRK